MHFTGGYFVCLFGMVAAMHSLLKNITIISFGFLILNSVCTEKVHAEERVITLGGREGWSSVSVRNGVTTGVGTYGYDSMTLDTNSRHVSKQTDLLLDFEDGTMADISGHYKVISNALIPTTDCKMGKGSGLSQGKGGLRLDGDRTSLFGTPGIAGSFLIEFWLNPAVAENGETVLSWRSSRTVDDMLLYQMINASFANNHLTWNFTNVFDGYEENFGEISISSYSTIIPDSWTHHAISFDNQTGLLEYRINGRLEALKYITSNSREIGGRVFQPVLGVAADLDICPSYTGLIDDFRIQRSAISETASNLRYDTYNRIGGRFVTDPIKVSLNSEMTLLNALTRVPDQTDVMIYVRSGDNYFPWTDTYPEWIPVSSGEKLSGIKGLYFQVAMDLYPDGSGSLSPSVDRIDLHFKEVEAPLPPFRVLAEAGNGEVTLKWTYSVDNNTGGYYVYYGDRPGEYLGREAVSVDTGNRVESPVDVGNTNTVTFKNLKNGKIYYFAIAAYSDVNKEIMGTLSKEVWARPLRR